MIILLMEFVSESLKLNGYLEEIGRCSSAMKYHQAAVFI